MARGQSGKNGAPAQSRAVVEHKWGLGAVLIPCHNMEAKSVPEIQLKREPAIQAAVRVR